MQVAQDLGEKCLRSEASDGPEDGGGAEMHEPLRGEAGQNVEEDKEGEEIWT